MPLAALKQAIANRMPQQLLLALGRHNRGRRSIARRFLRGAGIEVGALGQPLLVPQGVRVSYVDRISKAEALARFPALGGKHLVKPTVIGDGFSLDFIAAKSQDFVIANHVLEHSPDPLGVLLHWSRILKPGGILFVTVPHVDHSFDRGRSVTPLAHLVEDHGCAASGNTEALWTRSRSHYTEWVTISQVNAEGPTQARLTPAESDRLADQLLAAREEIHFHTFTEKSYTDMLAHFAGTMMPAVRLVEVRRNRTEIIGILEGG